MDMRELLEYQWIDFSCSKTKRNKHLWVEKSTLLLYIKHKIIIDLYIFIYYNILYNRKEYNIKWLVINNIVLK